MSEGRASGGGKGHARGRMHGSIISYIYSLRGQLWLIKDEGRIKIESLVTCSSSGGSAVSLCRPYETQ